MMFQLFRIFSYGFMALASVNIFAHVYALDLFKTRRAKLVAALMLAGLNAWGMREIFSTSGMALLNFSCVLIAFDMVSLILRLIGKQRKPHKVFKRLLRRGLAFAAALIVTAYGLVNIHIIRETGYEFAHPNVQKTVTVGLISDAHLSNAMTAEKLLSEMRAVIDGGADILVLAGDLMDEGTQRAEFEALSKGLETVRAPMGVYYVFGNHDASNFGGCATREEIEKAFTLAGVTVLTDETVLLDGWLRIAGRNEAGTDRLRAEKLLEGADQESEFIIVIDHQPAEIAQCALAGADLHLSGHTHNGQIFPVNVLSVLLNINEIEYGHKNVSGMNAVVSSGISGWSAAFRTAGRSEAVLITLTGNETAY